MTPSQIADAQSLAREWKPRQLLRGGTSLATSSNGAEGRNNIVPRVIRGNHPEHQALLRPGATEEP
jgi:hypothetical protein